MSLRTMTDLTFTIHVDRWTWIYAFTRRGSVTWRDPNNGMHGGGGTWRHTGNEIRVSWPSGSWDTFDLPINPNSTTGRSYVKGEGEYDLWAEATNYYLRPGDVVTVGSDKYVVHDNEIRSGGTVAWICRNPGNIRDGDRFGAYKGKKFQTASVGAFAIFPDEETAMQAIVSVLKGYGRISIAGAMKKYAPASDGNNPAVYANTLAAKVGVSADTLVSSLDDSQMNALILEIKRVEGWKEGARFSREDTRLPEEVRMRLSPHFYPPTPEEIQNSSIGKPW